MVIFFRNVRECIIPRRSLVTIHTRNLIVDNIPESKNHFGDTISHLSEHHNVVNECMLKVRIFVNNQVLIVLIFMIGIGKILTTLGMNGGDHGTVRNNAFPNVPKKYHHSQGIFFSFHFLPFFFL